MRFAVIDIGSNTIKMTIFGYKSNKLYRLMHTTKNSGLIGYIENGQLSDKGIRVLSDAVEDFAAEAGRNACFEVYPFATASLRKAQNYEDVILKVEKQTGYTINMISGFDEAALSFDGVLRAMGDQLSPTGLTVDMGGGSTELVSYSDLTAVDHASVDIGVLALFNEYVKNIIPSGKECAKISKFAEKTFSSVEFIKNCEGISDVYMMGGTARALVKLHTVISRRPYTLPYTMEVPEIEALLANLMSEVDNRTKLTAIREIPPRIHTICPGIIAILALMKLTKATRLTVTDGSVREGYALRIARENGYIDA